MWHVILPCVTFHGPRCHFQGRGLARDSGWILGAKSHQKVIWQENPLIFMVGWWNSTIHPDIESYWSKALQPLSATPCRPNASNAALMPALGMLPYGTMIIFCGWGIPQANGKKQKKSRKPTKPTKPKPTKPKPTKPTNYAVNLGTPTSNFGGNSWLQMNLMKNGNWCQRKWTMHWKSAGHRGGMVTMGSSVV